MSAVRVLETATQCSGATTVRPQRDLHQVPEALSIVDEFPRNALSKLDRSKLQAMAVAVQSAGQMEAQPSQSKQCREPPPARM
jgi:acyl-coenzyme A synthetase/AMP-(fatty) acid ligase